MATTDEKLVNYKGIRTLYNDLRARTEDLTDDLAEAYDGTKTYEPGDYAMFGTVLKKYDGTTWTAVRVTEEMGSGGSTYTAGYGISISAQNVISVNLPNAEEGEF